MGVSSKHQLPKNGPTSQTVSPSVPSDFTASQTAHGIMDVFGVESTTKQKMPAFLTEPLGRGMIGASQLSVDDEVVFVGRCIALQEGGFLTPGSVCRTHSVEDNENVSLYVQGCTSPITLQRHSVVKLGARVSDDFCAGDVVFSCIGFEGIQLADIGIVLGARDNYHLVQFSRQALIYCIFADEVVQAGAQLDHGFKVGEGIFFLSKGMPIPLDLRSIAPFQRGVVLRAGRFKHTMCVAFEDFSKALDVPVGLLTKTASCDTACQTPNMCMIDGWPFFATLADTLQVFHTSRWSRGSWAALLVGWPVLSQRMRSSSSVSFRHWTNSILYKQLSLYSASGIEWQPPQHSLRYAKRVAWRQSPDLLVRAMAPILGTRTVLGDAECTKEVQCRTVTLGSFSNADWNGDYIEYHGRTFEVDDRETYWSVDCQRFLHFHQPSRRWRLAIAKVWHEVFKTGEGPSLAHTQDNCKIRDPRKIKGWYELKNGVFAFNRKAGVTHLGKTMVLETITNENMLSTFRGGNELFSIISKCSEDVLTMEERACLRLCQQFHCLPSDHGMLVKKLEWQQNKSSLTPLEFVFLDLCNLAASGVLAREVSKAEEDRAAHFARTWKELEQMSATTASVLEKEELAKERRLRRNSARKARRAQTQNRSYVQSESQGDHDVDDRSREAEAELLTFPSDGEMKSSSELALELRNKFAFLDDAALERYCKRAEYERQRAIEALSALASKPSIVLEPIPRSPKHAVYERIRVGSPKTIIGNVIARTDHSKLPFYCFIVLVAQSDSENYREGSIVRPIPENRYRIRGDESGHFWMRRSHVPELGSVVQMKFYEEDFNDYLQSIHGNYPHQNEDLLCTTLNLIAKCDLGSHTLARARLLHWACDDIAKRWPWRVGLQRFPSVIPGKYIWHVPAAKKHLPSVVILKINPECDINFKYRNAAGSKVSVDFSAGSKRLTDIPVTAADFSDSPYALNLKFAEKRSVDQLFVLGLARAERRGPEGFNRFAECSEKAQSLLNEDDFEEYCQIMLIGTIELPQGSFQKHDAGASSR